MKTNTATPAPLTTLAKSQLISAIVSKLKFEAAAETARGRYKAFDEGDTFFALCFRTDDQLRQIAKLAGC